MTQQDDITKRELTDDEFQALWDEACKDSPQAPGWNRHIRYGRAIESAVLSKLRAPAADQRGLLPCPFCGSEAFATFKTGDDDLRRHSVHCKSLDCGGQTRDRHFSEAEAIAAWNRRAALASAPVADERAAFARSITGRDDLEPHQVQNVIDANGSRWATWRDRAALATVPLPNQPPIRLSAEVLEYLKEGIENATQCEEADIDHDFANELGRLIQGPLFGAPPASAPVAGEQIIAWDVQDTGLGRRYTTYNPKVAEDLMNLGENVRPLVYASALPPANAAPQASECECSRKSKAVSDSEAQL